MTNLSQRFVSLDVFRGIAIASMILVNNPGSWGSVYPPLLHAEWHGFTPTDWVFPGFLFISGTTMAFSLRKYMDKNSPNPQLYWHIFRRCLILFALGFFLNESSIFLDILLNPNSKYVWMDMITDIRIMGVLQRISLAYFFGAVAVLNLPKRGLWALLAGILIGYWLIMMLAGDFTQEGNFAGYIDRLILGQQHIYTEYYDPEGLFSTIPSVGTVLLGYLTGYWLRDQPKHYQTSLGLVAFGLIVLILGSLWGLFFPINKALWTSSYVLYSAGWSLLVLALCYELIEVRNIRRWTVPFRVMGLNAIFVFVASGFIVRILYRFYIGTGENAVTSYAWLYNNLFLPWAGAYPGSLLFAMTNVFFWFIVLYIMYLRGWFIKI